MKRFFVVAALTLALAGYAPTTARAANIVLNPGFDLDDTTQGPVSPPTNWTVGNAGSGDVGADHTFPRSSPNDAFLGDGDLSQVLTTSNAIYSISFWVGIDDTTTLNDGGATFDATFGGTDLMPGGSPIGTGGFTLGTYQGFTATVTASAGSTTLDFTGHTSNDTGAWYLDDVSVTTQAQAVPEPTTGALLFSALGLIGLARRRA